MNGKKPNQKAMLYPDQVILNKIQQKRLAMLSGVSEKEIKGKNIAELSDKLKWHIDPRIFFFEKICGKVVKKDPVTGVEYPVPFATVYVEDTDCNFITYCPPGYPWIWHFPLFCHREVIGTVHTDACGNFCVWVPRFDIDWILHWRKERICFPIIFKRPHIGDYITKYPPIPEPGPDPGPIIREHLQFNSIAGGKIESIQNEITRIQDLMLTGKGSTNIDYITNKRVFDHEVPPPLPADFQKALSGQQVVASKRASAPDAILSAIAEQVGLNAKSDILKGFNHLKYIGPFYRCYDFYLPVWQLIYDVPDITFRVTQDTNGDGIEENIYSEGFCDVRWDSGPISNVILVASSSARESRICNVPDVPCGNVPALQLAGMMPLDNPSYFNSISGDAVRPNRPKPSGHAWGASVSPAQTPFCGTLGLFGCVDVQSAKYYRIEQSTDGGATYSAITGLSWNNYVAPGGTPVPIVADVNGWYLVQPLHPVTGNPIPRVSLELPTLIFVWPTPPLQKTILRIELGNNSKAHLAYSAPVAIESDNTYPTINYTKWSWKYAGEPDSALRSLLGIACPMIKRGAIPRDIEVVFEVSISANHLRDASIWTSGCGGGNFVPAPDPANNPDHWHQTIFDNSEVLYQRYSLSAGSLPGCYSFVTWAGSRSINPAGIYGENLLPSPDWYVNEIFLYVNPYIAVAVVNENL
jgi:hypothetical protein